MSVNKGCRPDPKTMPVTREYAEGHERIFGKTKRRVGRFVFNPKTKRMEEVGADWKPTDSKGLMVFGESHYSGLRTADGMHDISTKAKHRAYMKERNVGLSHELTETRAKGIKERESYFQGTNQEIIKGWRETIGRNLYQIESRKRRRGR